MRSNLLTPHCLLDTSIQCALPSKHDRCPLSLVASASHVLSLPLTILMFELANRDILWSFPRGLWTSLHFKSLWNVWGASSKLHLQTRVQKTYKLKTKAIVLSSRTSLQLAMKFLPLDSLSLPLLCLAALCAVSLAPSATWKRHGPLWCSGAMLWRSCYW